MRKVKLTNDFHNTETVVIPKKILSHIYNEIEIHLSDSQKKRAWKNLCGMHDCSCSGLAGERGNNNDENGKRIIVEF